MILFRQFVLKKKGVSLLPEIRVGEAVPGMDMPFAPLCDTIVCWNNRVTIVHEAVNVSYVSENMANLGHQIKDLPTSTGHPYKFILVWSIFLRVHTPSSWYICKSLLHPFLLAFFCCCFGWEELVISGWNVADGYLPPAQLLS